MGHWKILALVLLAVALAIGPVSTALAAPPTPTPHRAKSLEVRHGAFGTVKSISIDTDSTSSFVLTTKQGELVVNVNGNTKYRTPGKKEASFAVLKEGDRVAVSGRRVDGAFWARHVNILPKKPYHRHYAGVVTAYTPREDSTPGSITIDKAGVTQGPFQITADTKIHYPAGITEIKIGDRVTIISTREPVGGALTAQEIVVHPKKP
jgi:Cu/Ag efflux protein CusF